MEVGFEVGGRVADEVGCVTLHGPEGLEVGPFGIEELLGAEGVVELCCVHDACGDGGIGSTLFVSNVAKVVDLETAVHSVEAPEGMRRSTTVGSLQLHLHDVVIGSPELVVVFQYDFEVCAASRVFVDMRLQSRNGTFKLGPSGADLR